MKPSRILSLLLFSIAMALLLVACGESNTPTPVQNFTPSLVTFAPSVAPNTVVPAGGLPTFTAVPSQAPLATVTPLPTVAPTTTAATTIQATTTVQTTIATTEAPTTTTTTTNPTTAPITTTKAPTTTKPATTTVANSKVLPFFQPLLTVLKKQSDLPILLPTYVPGYDGSLPYYAINERGDEGYRLEISLAPDCNEATACHAGFVEGLPEASAANLLKGPKFTLAKNLTGYYTAAECGASCSDATLSWKENKAIYTVGIKAGKQTDLVKMANSAITAGAD